MLFMFIIAFLFFLVFAFLIIKPIIIINSNVKKVSFFQYDIVFLYALKYKTLELSHYLNCTLNESEEIIKIIRKWNNKLFFSFFLFMLIEIIISKILMYLDS